MVPSPAARSSSRVRSFASSTFGWSNGSMPSATPALVHDLHFSVEPALFWQVADAVLQLGIDLAAKQCDAS
jgi:hypothetical protein